MKKYKITTSIILGIIIISLFTSCVSNRKINLLNKNIVQKNKIIEQMKIYIDSIQTERTGRLAKNEMDPKINTKINEILDSAKQLTVAEAGESGLQIINHKLTRLQYKQINDALFVANNKTIGLFEDIKLVNDLMQSAKAKRYNTGSFFGPGKFELAPEVLPQAKLTFDPIVGSILKFAKKYPNKKLETTIIILGYADAQNIKAGTELYNFLAKSIGVAEPTREQLNIELSKLRAISISKFIQTNSDSNLDIKSLKIQYIAQGRGEELPNPQTKDYKDDDERRRIVMVYWSVLPI